MCKKNNNIKLLPDKTLRQPLESWRCRRCRQYIDYTQLKVDPGATYCWDCKWKVKPIENTKEDNI